MKYLGLDGKSYTLNTTRYLKKPSNKSKLHLRVREFLKSNFLLYSVLEEIGVRGCSKGTLYFDFMIPQIKCFFEAGGRQHFERVAHFHTKSEFLLAQQRDKLKVSFCQLNEFTLYNFNWDETEEDWIRKLNF